MGSNNAHKIRVAMIRQGDRGHARNKLVEWGQFKKILQNPVVDPNMRMVDYQNLSVDGQNAAKDVGSYVLGNFEGGVRKKENIKFRSAVSLDIDHPTFDQIDWIKMGLTDLDQYEYVALTSRSHTLMKAKYRILLPTVKPIPAEHYFAVSRILTSRIFPTVQESMAAVDDVSHRVAQVMYLPSRCKDQPFDYFENSGKLLDHEALLASYPGWEDYTQLPADETRGIKRPGQTAPAERPNEKSGPVGAFCRAYSVPEAIEKFLPDIYINPTKEGLNVRYTYAKGHGSKGALVYDDGLFLYSHHGTDPCGERNSNAWDMVRLHLFGDQDKTDAAAEASPGKRPSFKAMTEWANRDPYFVRERQRMQDERIDAVFALANGDQDEDGEITAADTAALDDPDMAEILGSGPAATVTTANGVEFADLDAEDDDDPVGNGPAAPRPAETKADKAKTGIPNYVAELNKAHSFAMMSGKAIVIYEQGDGGIDFGTTDDLNKKFSNNRVPLPKGDGDEPISAAWMRHPMRRQYMEGVCFDPDYTGTDKFNLWTGFPIEPNPKAKCALILRHMREVLTDSDEDFNYLIGWLAHMVQRPGEKPGVAMIFKGKKGSGKDTLALYLSKMLQKYYVMFSKPEDLYGNHNSQLERRLLVHLEEAMWAGDKQHEAVMKSMITGESLFINPKFINGYAIKSIIRIIMTSNEDWVVPATEDERRYAINNVKSTYKGNRAYFDALYKEMRSDGPAGLLAYLLAYDISTFEVRDFPDNEALAEQKQIGQRNITLMWREILMDGYLPSADEPEGEGLVSDWNQGFLTIPCDRFQAAYSMWMRTRRYDGLEMSKEMIGKKLKEMVPDIEKRLFRAKGSAERYKGYVIPPLSVCRKSFEVFIRSKIEWPELELFERPGDDYDPVG